MQFNHVSGIHGVAFVGFDTPNLPMSSGSQTTNAFTEDGTFYYYCTLHASPSLANEFYLQQGAMVGKVVVGSGGAGPTETPTATATPTEGPTVALDHDSVVPGVARE